MTSENPKKDQENLVTTSAEAPVELTEKELQQVAGGQKVKTDQQKYMEVKLENVLISSF